MQLIVYQKRIHIRIQKALVTVAISLRCFSKNIKARECELSTSASFIEILYCYKGHAMLILLFVCEYSATILILKITSLSEHYLIIDRILILFRTGNCYSSLLCTFVLRESDLNNRVILYKTIYNVTMLST